MTVDHPPPTLEDFPEEVVLPEVGGDKMKEKNSDDVDKKEDEGHCVYG